MKFRVLNERGIRAIHDTALMMLETIGMSIAGAEPRRALIAAGAKEKDGRILIGPDLVQNALSQVPPKGFELAGRDAKRRFRLVPGEVRFRPAGGPPFIIDYPSRTRRPATMEDAETIVRVADALKEIDVANSAVSPSDIGVGIRNVNRFVTSLKFSTKPTDITASSPEEVAAINEIALVIRGSREALQREPLVLVYVSPTSPMRISETEALAMMECARRGLPLAPLSCPTLAATAPATIAGGVAQAWAEELASIVLAYTIRPGLPVVACSRLFPADMRTGNLTSSGAAPGLATAAMTEVAAHFHLPTNGWGFVSSSHTEDLQAGAERMMGALLAALAGTNVISGAGTLDNALVSTPEQLVIDNEIIRVVRNALQGVDVSPDTLATEYLSEGVLDGTFMTSSHTVDCLRNGRLWMPDLFSAEPCDMSAHGERDLAARAGERVKKILQTHEVPALEKGQLNEIESILKAAGA